MNKPEILLHICCGPCSTVPIKRLSEKYVVSGFFYNPNIHPEKEYLMRAEEISNYCLKNNIELYMEDYDIKMWYEAVRGHENDAEGGKRCEICFKLRLNLTAEEAKKRDISLFTTTLSISPHKNHNIINSIGKEVEELTGIKFLQQNFKKLNGYRESCEISKKENMYRQNYCGCTFSQKIK